MQALPVHPLAPLTDRTTTRPPTEEAVLGPLCGPPARPSSPAGRDQQRPCQYCGRDPNPSRGSFLSPQAIRHGPAGDRCRGSLWSSGLCSRHARYKPRVNDSKYQEVLSPRNSPHQMCGPCLPRGPRHRPAEDALQRARAPQSRPCLTV